MLRNCDSHHGVSGILNTVTQTAVRASQRAIVYEQQTRHTHYCSPGVPGMNEFAVVHAHGVPRIFDTFRRWPLVPSSQLLQLRTALLHCLELSGTEPGREPSDAARKLLRIVTEELERRRRSRHT